MGTPLTTFREGRNKEILEENNEEEYSEQQEQQTRETTKKQLFVTSKVNSGWCFS